MVSVFLLIGVMGCASNPDQVGGVYVSPYKYRDYDCNQLAVEIDYIGKQVTDLYNQLKDRESSDQAQMGIALFLFWPSIFAIEGDGPEIEEYSRLRGEFEAMRTVAVQKDCSIDALSQ